MRPALATLAIGFALGVALARLGAPPPIAWGLGLCLVSRLPRRLRAPALALGLGGLDASWQAGALAETRARLAAAVDDRVSDEICGEVGEVAAGPAGDRFVLDGEVRVVVSAGEPTGVAPGDRVCAAGLLRSGRGLRDPGARDPRDELDAAGAAFELSAAPHRVVRYAPGDASPARWAARVQAAWAARLGGGGPGRAALAALVTGDTRAMSPSSRAAWRDAGVSHALAVSGLHLAAVALLVFAALRRAWAAIPALALRVAPARAAAAVALPLAVAYTWITGAPPSAVRALIVVALYLVGAALDRRPRLGDALGLAALIMLAVRPAAITDPSLELSFAAAAALALAGRSEPRARGWRRLEQVIWRLLAASLVTALATAPLTARCFGAIQPGGLLANLVAVPAVELVALPLGLVAALLGGVAPGIGEAIAALAGWVMAGVEAVAARVAAALPPWHVARPGPLALALTGLAIVLVLRARGRRRVAAALVAGLALVATAGLREHARRADPRLRVTFVDVGQGDAAVVELPGGTVWLIDAGGLPFIAGEASLAADDDRARRGQAPGEAVRDLLLARGIRRIDLAILSHPHPDHYLGLGALTGAIEIAELWRAAPDPAAPPDRELEAILAELAARGTRIVAPPLGTVWREGGAALTVLWPRYASPAAADPVLSVNDDSLVVRVDFAGRRVLFPGDLEAEGEASLVAAVGPAALAADVIKVPHHGSRTSSSAALVAAVHPQLAVISCGVANRFGFPAAAVVDRWRAAGAEVRDTAEVGAVTVAIAPDGALALSAFDR